MARPGFARSGPAPMLRHVDRWTTIIEPFRIKSVEPIRMTSVAEREEHLREEVRVRDVSGRLCRRGRARCAEVLTVIADQEEEADCDRDHRRVAGERPEAARLRDEALSLLFHQSDPTSALRRRTRWTSTS